MLAIVVVNQSIMEWPPLQDNRLSTRPASFRNTLRQGHGRDRASAHFLVDGKDFTEPNGNPENGFDLWRQCETTAGKSG
jgi:hypothetical protein